MLIMTPADAVTRRSFWSIGENLVDVETPCLIVDSDKLEENMKRMAASMEQFPSVKVRPHVKAHKTPQIARMQEQLAKACGFCCQKVAEAEAMVEAGLKDVLLSNVVVSEQKIHRLAQLAKAGGRVSLCFDSPEAIQVASRVAQEVGVELGALVELNVGQNRCGVEEPEDALELAKVIRDAPGLRFVGIQGYHGAAQHIRDFEEKKKVIANVAAKTKKAVDLCKKEGLSVSVVTGGGTGTYLLEAGSGVYTEVQPGSFIFNDVDYARNLNSDGQQVGESDWKQSLFVGGRVISRNEKRRFVVLDVGMKALSLDSGPPKVVGYGEDEVVFENGGDEHCKLIFQSKSAQLPSVGTFMLLVPGHCDPTVNLFDHVLLVRGEKVEQVLPIVGRGPGL